MNVHTSNSVPEYVENRAVGYLPMHCPNCDRRRLLYSTNTDGNVVYVECEKCSWDSELESDLGPAHKGDDDQRWWPHA